MPTIIDICISLIKCCWMSWGLFCLISWIFLLIKTTFCAPVYQAPFFSASIRTHIICLLFVAARHSHKTFIGLQLCMMFCHYDFMRNVTHVSYTMCWMMIEHQWSKRRWQDDTRPHRSSDVSSLFSFCGGLDLSFTSWVSDWDIMSTACSCTYNLGCINNCNNCLRILLLVICSLQADIKSDDVSQPTNHLWSFTVKQSRSILRLKTEKHPWNK